MCTFFQSLICHCHWFVPYSKKKRNKFYLYMCLKNWLCHKRVKTRERERASPHMRTAQRDQVIFTLITMESCRSQIETSLANNCCNLYECGVCSSFLFDMYEFSHFVRFLRTFSHPVWIPRFGFFPSISIFIFLFDWSIVAISALYFVDCSSFCSVFNCFRLAPADRNEWHSCCCFLRLIKVII